MSEQALLIGKHDACLFCPIGSDCTDIVGSPSNGIFSHKIRGKLREVKTEEEMQLYVTQFEIEIAAVNEDNGAGLLHSVARIADDRENKNPANNFRSCRRF